jgi:hypothetical protein
MYSGAIILKVTTGHENIFIWPWMKFPATSDNYCSVCGSIRMGALKYLL